MYEGRYDCHDPKPAIIKVCVFILKGDGPTIVRVNLLVRSISKIDDYKMVSLQY